MCFYWEDMILNLMFTYLPTLRGLRRQVVFEIKFFLRCRRARLPHHNMGAPLLLHRRSIRGRCAVPWRALLWRHFSGTGRSDDRFYARAPNTRLDILLHWLRLSTFTCSWSISTGLQPCIQRQFIGMYDDLSWFER